MGMVSQVPASLMRAHRSPFSNLPLPLRPALPGLPSVLRPLSFQSFTTVKSSKPFVFITIRNAGGWAYPLPHLSLSAVNCRLSPSLSPLECALTSHSQVIENTATLSPLESALTRFRAVTPLESALTKKTGGGVS